MSNVNTKIQLEIVDGAATKALAEFTKNASVADKALDGINKQQSKLAKSTKESENGIQSLARSIKQDLGGDGSDSVGRLASLFNGPMLIGIGSVIAAASLAKKALDLTLTAERNEQISNSFKAIAASAGLAGESLKSGLLAATQGLADDDDVLRAANKSIIELGANADKIPQIMEIARKSLASVGFGKHTSVAQHWSYCRHRQGAERLRCNTGNHSFSALGFR